jgi:ATP-binding cassette subfamily B protein/subfamily B ATP-binding cassette protein MsbA
MDKKEVKIEKSFDMKLFKRLYGYTKKFLIVLLFAAILMLLATVVDLVKPYLIKVVIDDYISPKIVYLIEDSNGTIEYEKSLYKVTTKETNIYYLPQDNTITKDNNIIEIDKKIQTTIRKSSANGAYFLAFIFFLVMSIGFVFNYVQMLLLNKVGQSVIYDLRADLFSHIQELSLSFHDKNPVGRLLTRVTNDMNNINEMYTNVVVTFLKDLFMIVGTIIIMFYMDIKLSLISLSTVPLVIISSVIFRRYAREAYREVRVKLARINATLSENIQGMKIIQLFNKQEFMKDKFNEINEDHLKSSIKETVVFAIFRPSMNLFHSISLALIVIYGGIRVMEGTLEFGVLVAFTTYIQQFYRPIFDLTEKFNILQSAMASLERIFMLFDEKATIKNVTKPISTNVFRGKVEFKNVTFAYKEGEPVLKNISFIVNPGETIAFVGATGSGKTTIMSLLTRLYDIQEGEILIDDINIKDYDMYSLRRNIASVLQDVFLFYGTISSNIRLLDSDITDEKILRSAKHVNADKFIQEFDDGYNHLVSERGSTLSAGQRQLLSFARALAFDPSILVLDEATSNIDTETELLIQDAISKVVKERTTFVVAHRLSTIKNADKIVVMHKGKIREVGNHNELIEKKGLYFDLYSLQYAHVIN